MKPTRLYIKQCSHCNKKYFGKTVLKDIEKYEGSGKLWKLHLKKHNALAVHIWNSEWYYDKEIMVKDALLFSQSNMIVESEKWFNLKEENGIDGGDNSEFIDYLIIGEKFKGDNNPAKKPGVGEKISKSLRGKKQSPEHVKKNSEFRKGKTKENYEPIAKMSKTISKKYSGLTKENSEMRRNHSKSLSASMTGKTKETCPRLAKASKTLSESLSLLKLHHRREIVRLIDIEGYNFKDIIDYFDDVRPSINQVKKAYKKYKDNGEI
jgi:hypothetical protein